MASISIVIVTYNSLRFIDRCLEPFAGTDPGRIEVIVVDNQSPDRTDEHVSTTYPWVKLIRAEVNGGFAAGNNLGFRHATAPLVLMLNPDAFVANIDQVCAMAECLRSQPDVAAIGPQLINSDGSHQIGDAGWRFGLLTLAAHMFFLHRLVPAIPSLYLSGPSNQPLLDVDWVCGACTMVRREVIDRIGGLDETIFMYGEDVEWCTRMRDAGLRVLYVQQFVVKHLQGATQKDEQAIFYSTKWIDSFLEVLARNRSRSAIFAARLIFAAGFLLRGALYFGDGALRRHPHSRVRSTHMWQYFRYVLKFEPPELAKRVGARQP